MRSQLAQEEQMRDMLIESTEQMQTTAEDLKNKLNSTGQEEGEWKKRFELQFETNEQLERQLNMMRDRMNDLQRIDSSDSVSQGKQLTDAELRKLTRNLSHDKKVLEGQLKDLEWRLNAEASNLERTQQEIRTHRLDVGQKKVAPEERRLLPKIEGGNTSRMSKVDSVHGVPDDQRILDPRKGPVKRAAMVRSLPKLDRTAGAQSGPPSGKPKKRVKVKRRGPGSTKKDPVNDPTPTEADGGVAPPSVTPKSYDTT